MKLMDLITERIQVNTYEVFQKILKKMKPDLNWIELQNPSAGVYSGLFRYEKDGYAYEITIRTIENAQYKWKKAKQEDKK